MVSPDVFGETVTVPGAVPDAGLRPNQEEEVFAVQFKLPVPTLVIWEDCEFGFKPTAPKKVIEVGETDITAVFTASVTGIVIGEFEAPGAETVSVPLYVPSDRPAALAVTVITPGVNVAETVVVSQD